MRRRLQPSEAAGLIERSVNEKPLHPQEWNPLVNRPASPNAEALEELKKSQGGCVKSKGIRVHQRPIIISCTLAWNNADK